VFTTLYYIKSAIALLNEIRVTRYFVEDGGGGAPFIIIDFSSMSPLQSSFEVLDDGGESSCIRRR